MPEWGGTSRGGHRWGGLPAWLSACPSEGRERSSASLYACVQSGQRALGSSRQAGTQCAQPGDPFISLMASAERSRGVHQCGLCDLQGGENRLREGHRDHAVPAVLTGSPARTRLCWASSDDRAANACAAFACPDRDCPQLQPGRPQALRHAPDRLVVTGFHACGRVASSTVVPLAPTMTGVALLVVIRFGMRPPYHVRPQQESPAAASQALVAGGCYGSCWAFSHAIQAVRCAWTASCSRCCAMRYDSAA